MLEPDTLGLCDLDPSVKSTSNHAQSSHNSKNGGVSLVSTVNDGQMKNKVVPVIRIRWLVNSPESLRFDYYGGFGYERCS